MADVVVVGCKLPHGLEINFQGKVVTLAGQNQAREVPKFDDAVVILHPEMYGETIVDAAFFQSWLAAYKDYAPVVSGAVFVARTEKDLRGVAKERVKDKTGFEPAPKDDLGITAEKVGA